MFLTDYELQDPATLTYNDFAWIGASYDKSNLQSANGIISNTQESSVAYINTNPMLKQLSLQPIRNVYIHSTNLGSFQSKGAHKKSSCKCKSW